jgi:DNA polymerase-1
MRILAADYSQIELRVLAHLSRDPVLLEAFRTGEDVHARTAREVFGVAPGEVTSEMRRVAKAVNFGVIYGQGDSALAKSLGISRLEAGQFIAAYFRRYAGVTRFMNETLEKARMRAVCTPCSDAAASWLSCSTAIERGAWRRSASR